MKYQVYISDDVEIVTEVEAADDKAMASEAGRIVTDLFREEFLLKREGEIVLKARSETSSDVLTSTITFASKWHDVEPNGMP